MNYAAPRTTPRFPWLLLFALALAAVVIPPIIRADHADLHTEAEDIRCSNRVLAIFLNKSCERLNVLKELSDGRVGDHVVQPCKRGILEVTAYVIGGGTLDEAIAALLAKGCVQIYP